MAKSVRRKKTQKKRKQTYGRIDDRGLLRLIVAGGLACDKKDGTIYRVRGDRRKKIPWLPDKKGHYWFVYVYHKANRRKIAVSRLVWMIVERDLVPRGCDVHHRDEDRSNNAYDNLEPEDLHEHRSKAGKKGAAVTNGYPPDWDDVEITEDEYDQFKHADEDELDEIPL